MVAKLLGGVFEGLNFRLKFRMTAVGGYVLELRCSMQKNDTREQVELCGKRVKIPASFGGAVTTLSDCLKRVLVPHRPCRYIV